MGLKIVIKFSLAMVVFIGLFTLVSPRQVNHVEAASSKYEQRNFSVEGKGDVRQIQQMQRKRRPLSPYEPTGLYIKADEPVEITVSGTEVLYGYISTYATDQPRFRHTLHPGVNTISNEIGGMLYLSNTNPSGYINAEVTKGGAPVPFFELGKHTKADWDAMMDLYASAPYVQLKSERVLMTIPYSIARTHLYKKDPTPILQKHDEAAAIQDTFSGTTEASGINQVDRHYLHYVERNVPWMTAYDYLVEVNPAAMAWILDVNLFTKDGWGPWHEQGHTRQQNAWIWDNSLIEVTNNLFSLEIQTQFGNKSNLETSNVYSDAVTYFKQPNKDFNALDGNMKLAMFWQLRLSYGDDFYPSFFEYYRMLPENQLPVENKDKEQFFMISASKVAKQNLIPFFEMWGLYPTSQTKQAIEQLNYPLLTAPIWNTTDANIVKPNVSTNQMPSIVFQGYYDWDSATISFDLKNQVIVSSTTDPNAIINPYFEGEYFSFTLYDGATRQEKKSASTVAKTTPSNFVGALQNTPFKFGDIIKVDHAEAGNRLDLYLSAGTLQTNYADKEQYYIITEDGLVPTTNVALQKIVFQGIGDWDSATLSLDPDKQTLIVNSVDRNGIIHNYIADTYYSVTLYDGLSKKEKASASAKGTDTPAAFVDQLHGTAYQIGDIIKVTHNEAASRLDVYPAGLQLTNSPETTQYFKLTENGFVPTTDAALQKIVFQGYYDWDAATLSLDPINHTLLATTGDRNRIIHPYVSGTYYSVALYDGASHNEIMSASTMGSDTAASFVDQIQGVSYKIGDIIKVTHQEAVNRLDVYPAGLQLTNSPETTQYFKLTENGFVPTTDAAMQKIVFQGYYDWDAATLSLDPINHTLLATTGDRNRIIHPYVSGTYYSVTLYDGASHNEIMSASTMGSDTAASFVDQLQGVTYKIGDIIKVTHQEADKRLDVYPAGLQLTNSPETAQYFQLTEKGFVPTAPIL